MPKYVGYFAVLPSYRSACIQELRDALGPDLQLFASSAHLDATVKTGVPSNQFQPVRMIRVGRLGFLQIGGWLRAVRADSTIVDLNPRSLSAWIILVSRRILKRRTLVWGHLHPRNGPAAQTIFLRHWMRRVATGTITYTYSQASDALMELPGQPIWVAPNALYSSADMNHAATFCGAPEGGSRTDILYVGRLEAEKKVEQIVPAFASHAKQELQTRLVVVGDGSQKSLMEEQARREQISHRIIFAGRQNDFPRLAALYRTAFCSISPGFAGLGLTQSLGFGVPQIIAEGERHSPEIELATQENSYSSPSDDVAGLGAKMTEAFQRREELPLIAAITYISGHYSAEAMASGLIGALRDDRASSWKSQDD